MRSAKRRWTVKSYDLYNQWWSAVLTEPDPQKARAMFDLLWATIVGDEDK